VPELAERLLGDVALYVGTEDMTAAKEPLTTPDKLTEFVVAPLKLASVLATIGTLPASTPESVKASAEYS
jgi:hypothetical protein